MATNKDPTDRMAEIIHQQAQDLHDARFRVRELETIVAQHLPHPSDWQGKPATVFETVVRAKAQLEEFENARAAAREHFADMVEARTEAENNLGLVEALRDLLHQMETEREQALGELENLRTELDPPECRLQVGPDANVPTNARHAIQLWMAEAKRLKQKLEIKELEIQALIETSPELHKK